MSRVLLTALALVLVFAAPASAQDQQDNLARAAAYWGAGPACPDGVHVTVDEAFVGPDTFARGGGCGIWVGDRFAAESAGGQCQTITHEWGHLLGYGEDDAEHMGLAADPVGVMTSYAMPPTCAALDSPAPVASPAPLNSAPARLPAPTRRSAKGFPGTLIPAPLATIIRGPCPYNDALECTDRETATIYLSQYANTFALEHALGHLFDAQRLDDGERAKLERLLALPGREWRSGTGASGGPSSPSERFADAYAACRMRLDPVSRWMSAYDYQPSRREFRRTCATISRAADLG